MKNYVYRGIRYTKDENGSVINVVNEPGHQGLDKVYRGSHYFNIPSWQHLISDHVYRGAHYAS